MKKKLFAILPLPIAMILTVVWQLYFEQPSSKTESINTVVQNFVSNNDVENNPQLLRAYQDRLTKLQVKGQGRIIKVLRDDLEGSRHQRIILKVNNNQTVLIAHNIDLAPRIAHLQVGHVLEFYGEYIWNNKGGVIHWTHRDPRRKHADGWLKYQNKRYQ